jgi:hypothetical protein
MPKKKVRAMRNAQDQVNSEICEAKEFKDFQLRWIRTLENKSAIWEGPRAMNELKPHNAKGFTAFNFLRDKSNWRQNELLGRIFLEVKAYQTEKRKLFSQESKDIRLLLTNFREKLLKREGHLQHRKLQAIVTTVINATKSGLRELKSVTDAQNHSRSPLTRYEDFFPEQPRGRLVQRSIELDTRIQIQMAKMFMFYLGEYNITRLTVARLIVLTYWVGKLADEHPSDGTMRIFGTCHLLRARNVQDKIARLQRPVDPNA